MTSSETEKADLISTNKKVKDFIVHFCNLQQQNLFQLDPYQQNKIYTTFSSV